MAGVTPAAPTQERTPTSASRWTRLRNAYLNRAAGVLAALALILGLLTIADALFTGRGASGQIYAGLSNGAIWQSADYGEHWEQLPVSLGRIGRSLVML